MEAQFIQVTNADKKMAKKYLKQTKNNLEQAIDEYFQDVQNGVIKNSMESLKTSNSSLHKKAKQNLFDIYANNNVIDLEGTEKLLNDLEINPEDEIFIAISYYFESPSMCEFTEAGFQKGCSKFGITNIESFKQSLSTF